MDFTLRLTLSKMLSSEMLSTLQGLYFSSSVAWSPKAILWQKCWAWTDDSKFASYFLTFPSSCTYQKLSSQCPVICLHSQGKKRKVIYTKMLMAISFLQYSHFYIVFIKINKTAADMWKTFFEDHLLIHYPTTTLQRRFYTLHPVVYE